MSLYGDEAAGRVHGVNIAERGRGEDGGVGWTVEDDVAVHLLEAL